MRLESVATFSSTNEQKRGLLLSKLVKLISGNLVPLPLLTQYTQRNNELLCPE
jgi:hypothetical protein